MGLLQFLLPTSPSLLLLLPDRLRLLGHLLQENPGQPSLFPLHLVLHWRTPLHQDSGRDEPYNVHPEMLSHAAKQLQTLQLSNLKDRVSAVKARTLWETTLESHTETASVRALGLYSLGIRAALSGKAMQLCTEAAHLCCNTQQGFPGTNSSCGLNLELCSNLGLGELLRPWT